MQINLNEEEKNEYCVALGKELKRLRAIAGATQDDLARVSGISKERISRMENGAITMRWAHFVNFMMIFNMNANTKEYLMASKIITPRLMQHLQMKDSQVPPDIVVPVSDSLVQEFHTDFRIANSMSLKYEDRDMLNNKNYEE